MSSKKKKTAPVSIVTLATIVAAGAAGMYVPDAVSGPLAAEGLVEVNAELVNEAGEKACRATEAGIAKVAGTSQPAPVAVAAAPAFAIEAGVPVPAPIGRGRSGSKYPFDLLEIGQSFFVPDSEEQPDAAASLASTVSGATQRYASDHPTEKKTVKGVEVPKKVYARKFCLRKVEGGARVWRVEVTGKAE